MKKVNRIALATTAFLLCINWGMDEGNQSVSGGGIKPAFNFTGTVQDNTGRTFKATHITISGLYKQVPVYAVPKDMKDDNYNPTINTIRLDLSEVGRIVVPHPDDVHLFDNRKYIEIEVHSQTETGKTSVASHYLIEKSKKVLCEQVNAAGPIERELSFAAIQHINIDPIKIEQTKKPAHIVKKAVGATSKVLDKHRPVRKKVPVKKPHSKG